MKLLARETMALPTARAVEHAEASENELIVYERLGERIGYRPPKLVEIRLRAFLAERGWPVYDFIEVCEFLTEHAHAQDKRWVWRPLRSQDQTDVYTIGPHTRDPYWSGQYRRDLSVCRPYDKLVPMSVLTQVEQIGERFPSLQFFVSDYALPRPDPFIMVTSLDIGRLVFNHWDEPDWKG